MTRHAEMLLKTKVKVASKAAAPIVSVEWSGADEMSQDVLTAAITVISTHLGCDPSKLSADTYLDELGVNSLQLTEIIMDLEDTFDIRIEANTAEAWASLKTVGDIVGAVEKLIGARS